MDLNRVLIWLAATAGAVLFVRAAQVRRAGWAGKSFAVLAATLGCLLVWPDGAGYVGSGLLAVLVVLPLMIYRRLSHAALQQRYGAARRLAAILRWLHPTDGFRELPVLLDALAAGGPEAMARAAEQAGAARTALGRLGTATLFRMNNEWAELQRWIETHLSHDELRRDPNLLTVYFRSFGELGDVNGMLAAYKLICGSDGPQGGPVQTNMVRLVILGFCGREEPVRHLFQGPLAVYPELVQRFWLATAGMARGADGARAELETLRGQAQDPLTLASIAWRLEQAPVQADAAVTPENRAILDGVERVIDQEARYGARAPRRRVAWATLFLLAANVAVFVLETLRGGSTSFETLWRLGGMIPSAVARGEWGRLFLGTLLHYGVLHLAMNMIALLVLGPFVERSLGWMRYGVVYVLAGVGAMCGIVVLARLGMHPDELVVGASGSVMGLIGATGAVLLRGWAREGAREARRRLGFVVVVIVFQVAFDLTTPDISFVGHAGGLVVGFVAASLVRHPAVERQPRPS